MHRPCLTTAILGLDPDLPKRHVKNEGSRPKIPARGVKHAGELNGVDHQSFDIMSLDRSMNRMCAFDC